jgi:Mn2+/Fe2+ NRAMP family transporter
MAILVRMVVDPRIMGRLTAPWWLAVAGWLAVVVMALATIGFLVLRLI